MRAAVESNPNPSASDLLDAAERLLDKVLRSDCETRAAALDLLTVDALMTQSLLVANKDAKTLAGFAEQAMIRVGTHATQ